MVGGKGVSARTLGVVTLLLGLYVVARVTFLQAAAPLLSERPSGFGFRLLEPPELVARFGDSHALFYAYNVASQILTVLFSEPRGGVWALARDYVAGETRPSQWIGLVTSTGATLMIGWYVATRLGQWRRRDFNHADPRRVRRRRRARGQCGDQLRLSEGRHRRTCGCVSRARGGAGAAGAACHGVSAWRPHLIVAASLVIVVVSAGSVVRLVGTCFLLRERAFVTRNDWRCSRTNGWSVPSSTWRLQTRGRSPSCDCCVTRRFAHRTPSPHFAQGRSDYWFR
jgi:hypothetical protein